MSIIGKIVFNMIIFQVLVERIIIDLLKNIVEMIVEIYLILPHRPDKPTDLLFLGLGQECLIVFFLDLNFHHGCIFLFRNQNVKSINPFKNERNKYKHENKIKMGRSPFYAQHVVPIPTRSSLKELEDVFKFMFQQGRVVVYDDDAKVSTPSTPIYIRLLDSKTCPKPTLERCCSVYRKMEDHFPSNNSVYKVCSAILYRFHNRHSQHRPFEYHVLEVAHQDDNYYTTFCVRTDGAILNLESLSLRGYVSDVVYQSKEDSIVSH